MDAEYSPLESSHVRIAVAPSTPNGITTTTPSTPNHTPSQTPQTTPRKRLKIAFSGAENLAAQTPYDREPGSPLTPQPEPARDGVAALLILGSACAASLQAFDASFLSGELHWTVISTAINAASLPVLGGLFYVRGATSRPTGRRLRASERGGWLWVRSALGGLALNAAVCGVTHVDLASANTIMFSMPCFACALAALATKTLPGRGDVLILLTGFGGTIAVVAPGLLLRLAAPAAPAPAPRRTRGEALLGYGGALGFALSNAAACVVTSAKLRDARPLVLCAAQAFCALVLALAACYACRADVAPSFELLARDGRVALLLLLEVVSFPLSSFLRVAALVVSRNVFVVSLLYAEIPLVLLWDRIFRGTPVLPHQAFGVAVIIAGALGGNLVKTARGRGGGERSALLVSLPRPPRNRLGAE